MAKASPVEFVTCGEKMDKKFVTKFLKLDASQVEEATNPSDPSHAVPTSFNKDARRTTACHHKILTSELSGGRESPTVIFGDDPARTATKSLHDENPALATVIR